MQCQSAPISPRSAAASESTGFVPEWLRPSAAEFFNDVERRAGPVSPSKDSSAARPAPASSRRLRPRISEGSPQQRPFDGGAIGAERTAAEPLRLCDPEAGRVGGSAQPSAAPASRGPAVSTLPRGLRRSHFRAAGSGSGVVLRPEAGANVAFEAGETARRPGLAAGIALAAIRLYQHTLSGSLGPVCRFQPTCSHYAHDAIFHHGFVRGTFLAFKRLLRCRPLGGSGYDPVPR
jgi:uncharacterized protein